MLKEKAVLNIKEVKEIFINSNFFNWLEENDFDLFYDEDDDYDPVLKENFFYSIKYKEGNSIEEVNPMDFLHGRCCEFAVALARKFGYRIVLSFDYDEEGNFVQLIHAYCISKDNLIDVRGIYNNYNTDDSFISDNEFEYDWDNNMDLEFKEIDEAIEFLSKHLRLDSSVYDKLDEANKIIELFEEKYVI